MKKQRITVSCTLHTKPKSVGSVFRSHFYNLIFHNLESIFWIITRNIQTSRYLVIATLQWKCDKNDKLEKKLSKTFKKRNQIKTYHTLCYPLVQRMYILASLFQVEYSKKPISRWRFQDDYFKMTTSRWNTIPLKHWYTTELSSRFSSTYFWIYRQHLLILMSLSLPFSTP